MTHFDLTRARLQDEPTFTPFFVKRTEPLRQAFKQDKIKGEDQLLVTIRNSGVLALEITQISYHHVAQGELKGEPWLVTF